MSSLAKMLPSLLPLAIEWANRVSAQAAIGGTPLSPGGEELARRVGVTHPERVRIAIADELPFPEHPMLQAAALQARMLGPDTRGLTLGHTIFIRTGTLTVRLLSHELRHVHQYEAAGSIDNFLPQYLRQIATVGYDAAPFEVDATEHEVAG